MITCFNRAGSNRLHLRLFGVIRAGAAAVVGVKEEQRFNFCRSAEYPRLRAKKILQNRHSHYIVPTIFRSQKNGVLFDVGHGQGSFDWDVVEAAARIGFWPDLISTDLHSGNVDGPVKDLTTVASKFLHAGMEIYDVIIAS